MAKNKPTEMKMRITQFLLRNILGMETIQQPRYVPKPIRSAEESAERMAAADAKRERRRVRNGGTRKPNSPAG